ncbi:PLD nuclease N-terminal domain-containing protein [Ancrocorticia sp.]|uniref:PLD nuclease N-terminal domain-containing protein n=1 Tax=Ancrocorticia sp. TaxID=2593684 RepID=UPI003F931A27
MARIVPIVLAVAVWIFAIIDCARTDRALMPGKLSKGAWMALVIVLPVIGSFLWLWLSWNTKHPDGFGDLGGTRRQPPKGPVAPDDDPEFLARLDAENRFHEWERKRREEEEGEEEA